MAASDAHPRPIKNRAYRHTFDLRLTTGAFNAGGTGLDSEISKDGGAFTDCTNEATEIGSSGVYFLDLTATEMNADTVAVVVKSTNADNMPQLLVFLPESIVEPTAAPAWPMSSEESLGWIGALARNELLQTATTTTLRNAADTADIATSTVSDDGTTYVRGEWT